jgi:hypothetical protein
MVILNSMFFFLIGHWAADTVLIEMLWICFYFYKIVKGYRSGSMKSSC